MKAGISIGNATCSITVMLVVAVTLVLAAHGARARAPASCPPDQDVPRWTEETRTPHPLAGKVWSAQSGTLTGWRAFEETAASFVRSHDVILLGETHDNPLHHIARARLLRLFACAEPRPTFAVFEHLRADQKRQLEAFSMDLASGRARPEAAALLAKVGWDESGWPAAGLFLPLFQAALDTGLAILPGEPTRHRVRRVARNDAGVLDDAERDRLALTRELPGDAMRSLLAELKGSHCGMLPDGALAPMAAAQRFRDAHIADVLLAAQGPGGRGILLAGNGHVRKDRGVPWYLMARAPRLGVATVMLVEVDVGNDAPATYVPLDPAGIPAVDYIVFTPRAQREDPCAAMRAGRARKN